MYTFLPQHHPLPNIKQQKENHVKNYSEKKNYKQSAMTIVKKKSPMQSNINFCE
jgi:hypothetical protein